MDNKKATVLNKADAIFQAVEHFFCFYFSIKLFIRFMQEQVADWKGCQDDCICDMRWKEFTFKCSTDQRNRNNCFLKDRVPAECTSSGPNVISGNPKNTLSSLVSPVSV